jgi:hypothetical protein
MGGIKPMNKDRKMSTYLAHAEASADDTAQGRFAAPERKPMIVGAKAGISYPAQPEGSPWATNPYPEEPLVDGTGEGGRLGFQIDDMGNSTVVAPTVEAASDAFAPALESRPANVPVADNAAVKRVARKFFRRRL